MLVSIALDVVLSDVSRDFFEIDEIDGTAIEDIIAIIAITIKSSVKVKPFLFIKITVMQSENTYQTSVQ